MTREPLKFGEKDRGSVILDDLAYRVKDTTKAAVDAMNAARVAEAEIEENEDREAPDSEKVRAALALAEQRVQNYIVYIDARLDPPAGAPAAGAYLRAAWERNEAGVEDIVSVVEYLMTSDDEEEVDVPPTTPPINGSTTSAGDTSPSDIEMSGTSITRSSGG